MNLDQRISRTWPFLIATVIGLGSGAPAGALPLLSEVFYDAVGSDDGRSFVEVHAAPGTPLDGLIVEGINGASGAVAGSVALSGSVGADGIFLLADEASGGGTSVSGADLIANFDLQNGPDSVRLRSGETVLDALGYGDFAPDEFFAGEGSPAPDAPADSSLSRHFADLDTDDNARDWAVGVPTPGEASFSSVPEPAGGTLFGLGLALLAALRPLAPRPPARRSALARNA